MEDNKTEWAICPITHQYLTEGKAYRILYRDDNLFRIVDDEGDSLTCLVKGCSHVDDLNWKIKKEPNNMNKNREKLMSLFNTCRDEALHMYDNKPQEKTDSCALEVPDEDTPMGTPVRFKDYDYEQWQNGKFVLMTTEDTSANYTFTVLRRGEVCVNPHDDIYVLCEILPQTETQD